MEAKYTVEQMRDMIVSYLVEASGVYRENIKLRCSLQNDLSLDSLDRVELIMWCETKFEIAISDDEMDKICTVGDLFNSVEDNGRWL